MCIHVYNGSDSWPAVNVCNKAKQAKWWKTPGVRDLAGSAGAGVTDCVSVCLCLSDGDQNSRWDGCWCVWDEIQVRAVCVQMKQSWYLVRCVYTLAKVLNVYCSTEVRVCMSGPRPNQFISCSETGNCWGTREKELHVKHWRPCPHAYRYFANWTFSSALWPLDQMQTAF